jgi:hypothetical protein
MNAMQALQPQPFQYEARAYCDTHGMTDADDAELVRLSMAARELQNRMQPWIKQAAGVLAFYPLGQAHDEEAARLREKLGELQRQHARELGLELPAT